MAHEELRRSLDGAADVRAASRVVVEHLAGPDLGPSVYVERGGRLRCQALLGYRHLLDGFPPGTGVIGRTFVSGSPSVVCDVRLDDAYLEAHDGVCAEACFPVSCGGRTVGAVNLEAPRPLTDGEIDAVDRAAALLGARIEALGGPPPESASQRLVRHAIALAGEHDVAAIERAVVAAAVDITPLSSAMLLRRASAGEPFAPATAHGPLEEMFLQTPADSIDALAVVTRAGCSAYTVSGAEAGAAQSPGIEVLRHAGAASLAVLAAGPDRILVVGGDGAPGLDTEHCELLELLAAQASACLRSAASVSVLRTRAATDALTGLGHHGTFYAELSAVRAAGDVGVLVVDVDDFREYNALHGHPGGDRALRDLAGVLSAALRPGEALFRVGGDEFAAIVPGVDGAGALDVARRLHHAVAGAPIDLRVTIGAAASTPTEAEVSVVARADRALYAAKADGRDGVALDDGARAAPTQRG